MMLQRVKMKTTIAKSASMKANGANTERREKTLSNSLELHLQRMHYSHFKEYHYRT